jgi:CIC family chloride channel protein
MVFKSLALLVSLGSGTSGGLLAPMFMASAAMGGAFAIVMHHFFPGMNVYPGAFALVAMGAVFGAASRAAFTFIIFAFEITRDYNAVLPLMLVSVIADGVAILFTRNSIMTEKLVRRGLRIHTDYEPDVLHQVTVAETMSKEVPTVPANMPVVELAARVARHDPKVTLHAALPIVDDQGRLCGIITRGDLVRAVEKGPSANTTVPDAGTREVVVTYPDETLYEAVATMLRNEVGRLPVVDRKRSNMFGGLSGTLRRPSRAIAAAGGRTRPRTWVDTTVKALGRVRIGEFRGLG